MPTGATTADATSGSQTGSKNVKQLVKHAQTGQFLMHFAEWQQKLQKRLHVAPTVDSTLAALHVWTTFYFYNQPRVDIVTYVARRLKRLLRATTQRSDVDVLTVAQPDELSWSGNAAPPYPTRLTSTQQQQIDDSSCFSSDAGDEGSDVCNDVADEVALAGAFCYSAHSDSSNSDELASLNAAAAPWTPPAATEANAKTVPDTTHNSAAVAYSSSDARSDLADDVVSDVAKPGPGDRFEVLQMYVDAEQQLQCIRAVQHHQRNGHHFDPNSMRSVLRKLKSEIHQQYTGSMLLHNDQMRVLSYLKQTLLKCWKQFDACSDTNVLHQWSTLVTGNAELAHTILQQ
eukprot:1543-Heterococcus_DN1.PRE.2